MKDQIAPCYLNFIIITAVKALIFLTH